VSAYNDIGNSAFSNEADDKTKRPGETDPATDYYEWRDDEIFLTETRLAYNSYPYSRVFEMNSELTQISLKDEFGYPNVADQHDAMDVAAGHFLTHIQETTIQAYRVSSNLELKFFKQPTPARHAGRPGLAPSRHHRLLRHRGR